MELTKVKESVILPQNEKDGTEAPKKLILFVCTGNTCRSPMAELVFNADYKELGYIAKSAGLFAGHTPMSDGAKEALIEAGYTVPLFISRQITKELISEADIIVGISGSHAMQLIMANPEFAGKIYSMPVDISDPYGGNSEIYKKCLSDIQAALKTVAESLCNGI